MEDPPVVLGVDVARFGEYRSVVAVREGRWLLASKEWRGADLMTTAERASKREKFANFRAELGWRLRERFERGEIRVPDDPQLVSELACLRYQYDGRGRIRLEAKAAAKSRLRRSPDLADAVMLAFGCARRRVDPNGRDAITIMRYMGEEARAEGLLKDDDAGWMEVIPPGNRCR